MGLLLLAGGPPNSRTSGVHLETMVPLGLDGTKGQVPVKPYSKQGPLYQEQTGPFECHGDTGAGWGPSSRASGALEQVGGPKEKEPTLLFRRPLAPGDRWGPRPIFYLARFFLFRS